ncbi:hypothetical protein HN446_04625 [bacterium]|nr:hypothetical protein [bacterium]
MKKFLILLVSLVFVLPCLGACEHKDGEFKESKRESRRRFSDLDLANEVEAQFSDHVQKIPREDIYGTLGANVSDDWEGILDLRGISTPHFFEFLSLARHCYGVSPRDPEGRDSVLREILLDRDIAEIKEFIKIVEELKMYAWEYVVKRVEREKMVPAAPRVADRKGHPQVSSGAVPVDKRGKRATDKKVPKPGAKQSKDSRGVAPGVSSHWTSRGRSGGIRGRR